MSLRIPCLCLLLAGCVPKGKYELVDVQLQATRAAMDASGARCRADLGESEEAVGACRAEVGARQTQLDALTAELEGVRGELRALQEAAAARLATPEEVPADPEAPAVEAPEEAAVAEALVLGSEARIHRTEVAARQQAVATLFAPLEEKGVSVRPIPDGTVVSIPVAKLFNEERMSLSPLGISLLEQSAAALQQLGDHRLEVRGHTDARPHHSSETASNWELGFAWAMGVLRDLEEREIPMAPVASSWADRQPVITEGGPKLKRANRRVELVLVLDPERATRFEPSPPEDSEAP